jgi:hypothetical protein
MSTIDNIINESKKYLDGHVNQVKRFKAWETTRPIVKDALNKICDNMIASNDYFKSNLFVIDAKENPGVYIKSGQMPVPLTDGVMEQGFQIHFLPISNGRIFVFAYGHNIDGNAKQIDIEFIDDPSELTETKVIELVLKGIQEARKTSYLFAGDN